MYIRCVYGVFWQGNHQIYGHIRCIYTVLVNPKSIQCGVLFRCLRYPFVWCMLARASFTEKEQQRLHPVQLPIMRPCQASTTALLNQQKHQPSINHSATQSTQALTKHQHKHQPQRYLINTATWRCVARQQSIVNTHTQTHARTHTTGGWQVTAASPRRPDLIAATHRWKLCWAASGQGDRCTCGECLCLEEGPDMK